MNCGFNNRNPHQVRKAVGYLTDSHTFCRFRQVTPHPHTKRDAYHAMCEHPVVNICFHFKMCTASCRHKLTLTHCVNEGFLQTWVTHFTLCFRISSSVWICLPEMSKPPRTPQRECFCVLSGLQWVVSSDQAWPNCKLQNLFHLHNATKQKQTDFCPFVRVWSELSSLLLSGRTKFAPNKKWGEAHVPWEHLRFCFQILACLLDFLKDLIKRRTEILFSIRRHNCFDLNQRLFLMNFISLQPTCALQIRVKWQNQSINIHEKSSSGA